MKVWFLKLHRWIALLFAVPLAAVVVSGLILSVEPWLVTSSARAGHLDAARVKALLAIHDPGGNARALSYRSYDDVLGIGARGAGIAVDVRSGDAVPASSGLGPLFSVSRRIHETLMLDAEALVIASSFAMLALAALGVLLGWPRFANTLSGWHKALSWGLLPLVIASPLTGLFIAYRITFAPPPQTTGGAGPPLTLAQAVDIVGARHDLSNLVWLRPQGPRMLARLVEDGEFRVYTVTRDGTQAQPRNWPRLWHEGNFAGAWSSAMNLMLSIAMTGLLVTGVWLWASRGLRRRARRLRPV